MKKLLIIIGIVAACLHCNRKKCQPPPALHELTQSNPFFRGQIAFTGLDAEGRPWGKPSNGCWRPL